MGKMLKRLDNHLARSHKGITRAMNDHQPCPSSNKQNVWMICQFPHCKKQVKHLDKHIKNIHTMSVEEYHSRFGTEKEQKREENIVHERIKEDIEKEGGRVNENANYEDGSVDKNSNAEYSSVDKNSNAEYGSVDKNSNAEDGSVDQHSNVEDGSVDQHSNAEDGSVDQHSNAEDCSVDKIENEDDSVNASESGDEHVKEREYVDESVDMNAITVEADGHDLDDKLRFLVHNSSADGLRFLLTFMKKHHSLVAFSQSQLCRVFFKDATLSILRDIYIHRQHLASYYRLSRFYLYPDNGMIKSCLACDITEQGHCTCPVLPKAFYVYCKQECPIYFKCTKCVGFNAGASHKCFDFYHCKRCTEEYNASARYQPYPPGKRSFFH